MWYDFRVGRVGRGGRKIANWPFWLRLCSSCRHLSKVNLVRSRYQSWRYLSQSHAESTLLLSFDKLYFRYVSNFKNRESCVNICSLLHNFKLCFGRSWNGLLWSLFVQCSCKMQMQKRSWQSLVVASLFLCHFHHCSNAWHLAQLWSSVSSVNGLFSRVTGTCRQVSRW